MAESISKQDGFINFSSTQAISRNNSHLDSDNPLVQMNEALKHIQQSSFETLDSERKNQKELRKVWEEQMDEKAHLYTENARDKKWWSNAGLGITVLTMTLPFAGLYVASKTSSLLVSLSSRVSSEQITQGFNTATDVTRTFASQVLRDYSEWSSMKRRDQENIHEKLTQGTRMDLDRMQATVQDAEQNDRGLKERYLEVIKTLLQQVMISR